MGLIQKSGGDKWYDVPPPPLLEVGGTCPPCPPPVDALASRLKSRRQFTIDIVCRWQLTACFQFDLFIQLNYPCWILDRYSPPKRLPVEI